MSEVLVALKTTEIEHHRQSPPEFDSAEPAYSLHSKQTINPRNNVKTNRLLQLCMLVLSGVFLASNSFALDGPVFDLQNDWSTNSNPNGVWTYRAGSQVLPAFTWYDSLQSAQPSWGDPYPPTSPSTIPAWFRSLENPLSGLDWLAGDVVVHSQDDLNGGQWAGKRRLDESVQWHSSSFRWCLDGTRHWAVGQLGDLAEQQHIEQRFNLLR